MIITTNIEHLRDPFVLVENGVYYAYGTGASNGDWDGTTWACYKNTSGRLDGEWKRLEHEIYERPLNAVKNLWAPEVHRYRDKYYMFASYFSSVTNHRGVSILKSDSPEGPFVEITNGHITPHDWDAIDGTFYVDRDGRPWMVFVHEWTSTDDNIGRMAAARLSDDLTQFVSSPVELFRADAPAWSEHRVTDGCFLYDLKSGGLCMLWSNFASNGFEGYCVGVAHSDNGYPDGKWTQEDAPIFSNLVTGKYDGGHGMIFRDTDGKQYLCVHSPNKPCEECAERTIFVSLTERDGRLVCEGKNV